MLNPYQRGGIVPDEQLNNQGDIACGNANIHSNGSQNGVWPCYGQYNDDERITSFIGRNAYQPMLIYKNIDHYNASNPGNFTWNLFEYNVQTDVYKFIKEMASTPDTSSGPLTDYNTIAIIPDNLQGEHYVVQTIYYTLSISIIYIS